MNMKVSNRTAWRTCARWLLTVTALTISSAALAQRGDGPVPVRVATAKLAQMAPTSLVPGTVISRHDARVAAEVSGVLREVADIGTTVAVGQSLAQVDDVALRLQQTELMAQVERQQARLLFLDKEVRRLTELRERNISARSQLDQTVSDRDVARGDLAVAEARLAQIEDQLVRAAVQSPFDGVVVERMARPGERVSIGDSVVRVVDPNTLEVVVRAPLEIMPYLQNGDTVPLRGAGRDEIGQVRSVVAVGDENTHVFEARIDLSGAVFAVGQTIRATLPASNGREVLAVPRDALVLRPDSITVFVVDTEGEVSRIPVEAGLADGDWVEVVGAINPGDRVIVRGNERLRPGQRVSIQDAAAAS